MTTADVAIFLCVLLFILVGLVIFHFATIKYLNPYKLIFVFGKKGSGKSTLLTKWALQHQKRGWTVFSDDPIPGCYLYDPAELGRYELPWKSLVIVNEAGMIWHSRNFKKFPEETRHWFKLQRHRGVKVILASQSFDVDKSIRDLADGMYLVTNKFRIFSYGKRILRFPDLVEATGDSQSEARLVDQLKFDTFLLCFFGSRTLTYIPHWIPYFSSFAADALEEHEFAYVPYPDECDDEDTE